MQQKKNLTQMIYLWMEKTIEAKFHWVNLMSPLLRIHYYQNNRLQVKGILLPNTNLQLNPYLNTQLDLWCSDTLSFQCMASNTWLTNRCTDPVRDLLLCMNPSMRLTHQLEKDVGCEFLQFILTMKIKRLLGYKTLCPKTQQLLQRRWTEANCLQSQFEWLINLHQVASVCITLHHLRQPLK